MAEYNTKDGYVYKKIDGEIFIIFPKSKASLIQYGEDDTVELTLNRFVSQFKDINNSLFVLDNKTTNIATAVTSINNSLSKRINSLDEELQNLQEVTIPEHSESIKQLKENYENVNTRITNSETSIEKIKEDIGTIINILGDLEFAEGVII